MAYLALAAADRQRGACTALQTLLRKWAERSRFPGYPRRIAPAILLGSPKFWPRSPTLSLRAPMRYRLLTRISHQAARELEMKSLNSNKVREIDFFTVCFTPRSFGAGTPRAALGTFLPASHSYGPATAPCVALPPAPDLQGWRKCRGLSGTIPALQSYVGRSRNAPGTTRDAPSSEGLVRSPG
jgi:hypothetical protein